MLAQQVLYPLSHCSSPASLSSYKISHIVDFSEDFLVIIFNLITFGKILHSCCCIGLIISYQETTSHHFPPWCLDLTAQLVKWLLDLIYTNNAHLKMNNHPVSNILRPYQCPQKMLLRGFIPILCSSKSLNQKKLFFSC